jgi:hypothetical protein
MFSAEALRLAAIEVVTPYAALLAGTGFPTLAGKRAYDSRSVAVGDLDEALAYTPVLSFYTASSRIAQRGDAAAFDDGECEAVLEIIAELAVAEKDEENVAYADAMAGDDPEARLVLAALVSQVIYLLTEANAGELFRKCHLGIRRIEEEPFSVPNLGLRWQRTTIRLTCGIPQDRFDRVNGGLPEPVKGLAAALPDGSYARTKLAALAAHFEGQASTPLAGIAVHTAPGTDPIASTGDLDA